LSASSISAATLSFGIEGRDALSKERRLAPDFSYSTPHRAEADSGPATIHAYGEQAAERKRKFLLDASQLLLAVSRELREYGFTTSKVGPALGSVVYSLKCAETIFPTLACCQRFSSGDR
jgi:hypothetical protein